MMLLCADSVFFRAKCTDPYSYSKNFIAIRALFYCFLYDMCLH